MSQPHSTLRRDLGWQIAIAVVVGNVIGSGIFLKPGNIAAESGHFGTIISVWVLGGFLCLLGALCFAELSTMLPHAGGLYVYLREAYGKQIAFLFGWTEIIFGKPAAIGALAVAFVGSLTKAVGWGPTAKDDLAMWGAAEIREVGLATVVILILAWINVMGVLWGGRMQWATTVIKASFLLLIGLLPFALIPIVSESIQVENYATTVTARQSGLAGQIGAVLLAVMWAYNGWHGITPLAEEVEHPQRNIPLALLGGVGILTLLYVLANVAYHGVLSMIEMRAAGDHAAEEMLQKLLGPGGQAAMSAVIMCSIFGAINSNLLAAPRISFAMGRDRVFFRGLGRVHATFRTPAPAIVVMAGMAILLIVVVAVAKGLVRDLDASSVSFELGERILLGLQDGSIFSLLTNFVIFSASIFYTLGVLAVIVLRVRSPELERPYRTLGYPITPALFSAVYVWFLWQVVNTNPLESQVSLVLIALGIPVFLLYQRFDRQAPD